MNKVVFSKWGAVAATYVAYSEISRKKTKVKHIIFSAVTAGLTPLVIAQGTQATCGAYTNDVINSTYTCVPITVGDSTFSANGFLIGQGTGGSGTTRKNMYSTSTDITVGSVSARRPYTTAGLAIGPGGWDSATLTTNNTVSAMDVSLYLNGSTAGTNAYSGAGAAFGGKVWMNNFTLDIANANNGDINGLGAGAAYNTGQPSGAPLKNYVHIANNYNFTAIKASMANNNPTTGIRSILNNNGSNKPGEYGPQPIITIDGNYTADITAGYGNGVYVSGKWDQQSHMPIVNLNNTSIKITGSGNAIKIGKADRLYSFRRDGWGAGQLNWKDGANVNIDQNGATGEAIAIVYSGSVLSAPGVNEFKVVAQGNSIRVGNDILTNVVQASTGPIDVKINNAYFRTTTANTSLVQVDPQQKNTSLLFTGAGTDLTAAANGYIIDVQGNTAAASSAASLVFDGSAKTTGLVNKTTNSTLNVGLNNNSTWTLMEKTSGAVATSTFTNVNMTAGSTLNAFKPGDAAFVMQGQDVSSSASTMNLVDTEPNDVLTLTLAGGSSTYAASDGAMLRVDTCMGDDSAPSDVLKVNGNVSGVTTLQVNPATFAGSSCGGALTTGNGILVVQVTGESPVGSFVLEGGTITAGYFVYELVQEGKDWYLQSKALTGKLTVKKVVAAPAGAPAFSGSFPYTFTCTTPDSTGDGTIAVTDNQGSVSHTLQAGSQCAVEEGLLPSAPVGYKWASPVVTQPTGEIPPEGEQVATITNTLLALPVATVVCNPATLFDSAGQVSTCKVILNGPAPTGGLSVAITPLPTNNPRYTTTCGSSLTFAAGELEASCTITAKDNAVPGDGDEVIVLSLVAGDDYTLGAPSSATVTVQDDDKAAGAPTPIPTLGQWSLMLLGLGIAGLAARRRRLH